MFWDFDGVIKETVGIKGDAFAELFRGHGEKLMTRIRKHQKLHGGISRFQKIPLYLSWADLPRDSGNVRLFCNRFSKKVFQKVVEAPWVPGAKEFLCQNPFQQKFFLVTAAPQKEIEAILAVLDLTGTFELVFGAPVTKSAAIKIVRAELTNKNDQCLLIGDSYSDYQAAKSTKTPFLWRFSSTETKLKTLCKFNNFEEILKSDKKNNFKYKEIK